MIKRLRILADMVLRGVLQPLRFIVTFYANFCTAYFVLIALVAVSFSFSTV